MDKRQVLAVISEIEKEFGKFPHDFFRLLSDSEIKHYDYDSENQTWSFIKEETWHNIDMTKYVLWATTDNGDLMWWNGERVIAMSPRDFEFMSIKMRPINFIREITSGTITGIFPHDLLFENA